MNLQIETISTCNAACKFCDYSKAGRSGKAMALWHYQRIIREAATIPQIDRVTLSGLGEPLLDRWLDKRLQYTKQVAPHIATQLFTNGILMTPERLDSLRKSGLDNLGISLNANTAEQHERIMGVPGKFDTVVGHIEYAMSKHGGVCVYAVVNEDFTSQDAKVFQCRWGKHARCITDCNLTSPPDPNEGCWRALSSIMVMVDGRVTACVFDHSGKMVMGDLTNRSLRDVYNSDPYLSFRLAHHENRATDIPLCRNCPRGKQ